MSALRFLSALLLPSILAGSALASGTLTPLGSSDQPMAILDHNVRVVINNGFAMTEVQQTFLNPNALDLEAIYAFPVPKSACLSEMVIMVGEEELHGEVVDKATARRIYEEEKDDGDDAGLAEKTAFDTFEFSVARVPAQGEVSFRFVYYEKLELDTGVGRYLYPLEGGGNDEAALTFWNTNTVVERSFSFDVTLKSAWPVTKVRIPGYEGSTVVDQQGPGEFTVRLDMPNAVLERDLVFYYMLEEQLPGRIEVIPYREATDKPGTFMMVVTPGIDLHPITTGSDYVFVLDVSGSMSSKLATMMDAVSRSIGELSAKDRFRIVLFSETAEDVMGGFVQADEFAVEGVADELRKIGVRGGTNLYAGVKKALESMDSDRATSLVLVTDAVANQGVLSPKRFADLMAKYDVRVFGFLMGNSANWPLMRVLCDASGGFYQRVSNADDLLGQIMLAKSKVTHECLHDASLSISGVDVFETTTEMGPKVYRGQQLVMFGRYKQPGRATVELRARLTGLDRTYTTSFDFPEIDTDNPELERLWAMSRIEELELQEMLGLVPTDENAGAIEGYGVDYQLVTDETSMLVLNDVAFQEHGIERRNQVRTAKEHQAQAVRAKRAPRNYRVDRESPAFSDSAPRPGGGGALGSDLMLVALALAALAFVGRR